MAKPLEAEADAAAAAALSLLPRDAILVHIGVHKTGTTALQADLKRSRSSLGQHGLALPNSTITPLRAGRALVGGEVAWDSTASRQERLAMWTTFASDVAAEPGRLILSSETLCHAGDRQAKRLIDDLGPSRVHLLVAFRPLAALLPSTWQQYLKSGKHSTYDEWLSGVLAEPQRTRRPIAFWQRNDVAVQLARWSALLGADRVTAVVVDGRADLKVRRCIENLQGLPPGLLDPPRDPGRSNRSLTVAEAEMLRQVNIVARTSLSASEYVQHGAPRSRPPPGRVAAPRPWGGRDRAASVGGSPGRGARPAAGRGAACVRRPRGWKP